MYMPKDTPRLQVAGTDAGIEKEKVLKGIAVSQREFGPKQRPRVTVPREHTTSHHLPKRGFEMLTGGTEDPWIGPEGNKGGDTSQKCWLHSGSKLLVAV